MSKTAEILDAVRRIPMGDTRTYGQICEVVYGHRRAGLAVGNALRGHEFDSDVPWWRVTSDDGTFPGGRPETVAAVLQTEGVLVLDSDGNPWTVGSAVGARVA